MRNNYFTSKVFLEAQLWVFNGFAAISLAFYFSLFSAGNPNEFSWALKTAVIFFGIGLVLNAALAFLILINGKDAEYFHMLNSSKYFGWVPIIAVNSTLLAVLFLVIHFSWLAFMAAMVVIAIAYFAYKNALDEESKRHEEKMREYERQQLDANLQLIKMNRENELKNQNNHPS